MFIKQLGKSEKKFFFQEDDIITLFTIDNIMTESGEGHRSHEKFWSTGRVKGSLDRWIMAAGGWSAPTGESSSWTG